MALTKENCRKCKKEFAAKKLKLEKEVVTAGVDPPCQWEPTEVDVNGFRFTILKPPTMEDEEALEWYKFNGKDAYSKMDALSSLLLCPSCHCWAHTSHGQLNWKCANCGRFYKKDPQERGRKPYTEGERERWGVGTYRRKSKDLRWVR